MPFHTPAGFFEKVRQAFYNLPVQDRVPDHASLAHFSLSHLKLGLDQGDDKGVAQEKIGHGRDN